MARAERRLTWAGWATRQLLNGLPGTRGDKLDACPGTANGPQAEEGSRSSKSQGSTEGNGLLEPCEGKPSRTVLRGGGGGDAAPVPGDARCSRRGRRHGVSRQAHAVSEESRAGNEPRDRLDEHTPGAGGRLLQGEGVRDPARPLGIYLDGKLN